MDIAAAARTRHTAKAFDPARKIPEALVAQMRELLRLSPSSINSQPWHFLLAGRAAAKERIARAMPPPYAYNAAKVKNASHVVVFCARTDFDEARIEAILAREQEDGRYPDPAEMEKQRQARRFYLDLHRKIRLDVRPWLEKQVYLAVGTLLLGAATLGIDACPMEGFDPELMDAEFSLPARGLAAVAIVALGYAGPDDWNAWLPKSRQPAEQVITEL
jgi:nitroreductase/dihydropteridine reductase